MTIFKQQLLSSLSIPSSQGCEDEQLALLQAAAADSAAQTTNNSHLTSQLMLASMFCC